MSDRYYQSRQFLLLLIVVATQYAANSQVFTEPLYNPNAQIAKMKVGDDDKAPMKVSLPKDAEANLSQRRMAENPTFVGRKGSGGNIPRDGTSEEDRGAAAAVRPPKLVNPAAAVVAAVAADETTRRNAVLSSSASGADEPRSMMDPEGCWSSEHRKWNMD